MDNANAFWLWLDYGSKNTVPRWQARPTQHKNFFLNRSFLLIFKDGKPKDTKENQLSKSVADNRKQ
jgi:hypothetical protein